MIVDTHSSVGLVVGCLVTFKQAFICSGREPTEGKNPVGWEHVIVDSGF